MAAYYNEIDPYAAAWLRNLIAAGHIAHGDVDERSIVDVRPADLAGYTQCHFFAGIGVWSYALRLAGWEDDRPVWTGSCPCGPFSDAGLQEAFDDERDLWPYWLPLIRVALAKRRDVPILGEQVASKAGIAWLDALHADLEGEAYTVGALDTCAAGFGAPTIRQRFFFAADRLGDAVGARLEGHGGHGYEGREPGWLGAQAARPAAAPDAVNGFWHGAGWISCDDGRARPVEPGTPPLAYGATARVGRLRAYGNAINAEAAREFISAYNEVRGGSK